MYPSIHVNIYDIVIFFIDIVESQYPPLLHTPLAAWALLAADFGKTVFPEFVVLVLLVVLVVGLTGLDFVWKNLCCRLALLPSLVGAAVGGADTNDSARSFNILIADAASCGPFDCLFVFVVTESVLSNLTFFLEFFYSDLKKFKVKKN